MIIQKKPKRYPKFIDSGISFTSTFIPPSDIRGARIKIQVNGSSERMKETAFPTRIFSYTYDARDAHEECFKLYCLENETIQGWHHHLKFSKGMDRNNRFIFTIIFP